MATAQFNVLSTKPNFTTLMSAFFSQGLGRTTPLKAFVSVRPNSVKRVGPLRIVNEKVMGIDLGATNSAVRNRDRLVGQIAKRQAVVNPENTLFSVKMIIGKKMFEVDEELKQVSYKVVRDANGNVKIDCPAIGKQFAAKKKKFSSVFELGNRASSPPSLLLCVAPTDVWCGPEVGFSTRNYRLGGLRGGEEECLRQRQDCCGQ
ncbi:hypothetical protein EV1_002775 [Malus domestica]